MNKENNNQDFREFNNKFYFIGVTIGASAIAESGIAILDRELNLVRVDRAFNINDLRSYIKDIAPLKNMILCVDLPRNSGMPAGRWRQEAKNTHIFKLNELENSTFDWADRFSDKGSDFCNSLSDDGLDIYRYYCYFTKNMLKLNPPYKSRSPVACKYLQMIIKNNLKISGIPTNLIPLSGLDAIIGAYTGWKIAMTPENTGYKHIGKYKNSIIVTAI